MLMYLLGGLSTNYLGLGLVGGFVNRLGRLWSLEEGLSGLSGFRVMRGC